MPSVAADLILPWKGEAFRLIPSRFPPVDIYEEVVTDDRVPALVEIENLTNPRLRSAQRLMTTAERITPDSARLQNWNHAPFAYSNPEGSRFFPPESPCVELADTRQTALAVSVARREFFLNRTSEPAIGLDMRMLKTPVDGRFIDLRDIDPSMDKDRRWALCATLPDEVDGVLYRPPERPSATCVSVRAARALQRSIQTEHYRYIWNGVRVTKLYAFDNEGTELSPAALAGSDDVIAA